jgi:hypothetical protein
LSNRKLEWRLDVKRLAIVLLASVVMTAPALAQQNQGGNSLGNVLQDLGRSLSGQNNPPPSSRNYQNAYQQTYNSSLQQYRNESNQQLQENDQRLSDAWNQLRAASQALDDEMSRRGMQTGNNQNRPNGPNGGNYSGSSTRGNYGNGPAPYNGPNGPYNNGPYNGPNGGYNRR